ncbi:denticleless protein homolog [Impatiens glandulifera]|uniref:denticleless protein homolog n=1 Tax=Impatiens glandulifera TaxID=253017 RepID=UPI001FB1296A|nr:denticleless protein homolog [Impatiens glandulifera]
MESPIDRSFFQDIKSRELSGFRVRKRPYLEGKSTYFTEVGAVAVEHDGNDSPPMALSFCKTSKNAHVIAVADEDGFLSLYNTRQKLHPLSTSGENTSKARVSEWNAHENAIFDVSWIKEDSHILTASGDQTVKVWDAQEKKCTGILMGHTGSVKSVCPHPINSDLIASGSRDGSFALWDLRCSTTLGKISVAAVQKAHVLSHRKQTKPGKAASMSVTSVLYLKDGITMATAGAVNSVIKFWDVRNLKSPVLQACPHLQSSIEKDKLHGISSLSQDINGVFISASCMDNRIYLYNVLNLNKGPVKTFSGCRIESFFVKSAISPDAAHILAGSSDGNAYIWQVNKSEEDPMILKGHDGEVTAVNWSDSEVGKIATSSDDFTVRVWNLETSCYSNTRSPSSIRRRVMGPSTMECKKLFKDDEPVTPAKDPKTRPTDGIEEQVDSSKATSILMTPQPQEKMDSSSCMDLKEEFNLKTPEATIKSPSSVLTTPLSLKRTIRDYFTTA